MANWIEAEAVETLLQQSLASDTYIDNLIAHAQGLAEIEVGTQDTPSSGLKAILAQIVARMWQAGQSANMNPAALQGDVAGPFSYQNPNAGAAGLGLTNREKNDLRKAAGKSGLWVQPLTRGPGLEIGRFRSGRPIPDPDELVDVVGGEPVPYIDPSDLEP